MATLASLIAQTRKSAGLTQAELADRIKVSQGYIAQLETGRVERPGPDVVVALERVLGISRQEMHIAMGYLPAVQEFDFEAEVKRIAMIADDRKRAEALRQLPSDLRDVLDALVRARLIEIMDATRS